MRRDKLPLIREVEVQLQHVEATRIDSTRFASPRLNGSSMFIVVRCTRVLQ
jgi:hypothetical protein